MSVISQFSSGGVKSVQSGVATVAGTTTITSVSTTKTVVYSVSKGSTGTVAATGNVSVTGSITGTVGSGPRTPQGLDDTYSGGTGGWPIYGGGVSASGALSGGTTNLTTKQYSAKLTNATTITVDGPCEWQVVEYY